MRIQHNIAALNASNRLKANDNAISKNIAKLSSGYRINNAADDAAGLAVSEKMRAQINGLNQAQSNAENGISLVQTAEGGLNETEAILQRMNTLAVESANGTYQDGTDRANLNKEITALQSEIDRISTSTNFNQINLLDGSLSNATVTGISDTGISSLAVSGGNITEGDTFEVKTDTSGIATITFTAGSGAPAGADSVTFTAPTAALEAGKTYTATADVSGLATDGTEDAAIAAYTGVTITFTAGASFDDATAADATATINNKSLSLQIGSENKDDQRVSLSIGDMSSKGLGVNGVSIANQEDARSAIDTIKTAINIVSATRADLGALQNRLEHTVNNLGTTSENLTSAESRIRDVDMSSEMVELTKNEILEQAATSMLAQANTQPQSVLSLLQG